MANTYYIRGRIEGYADFTVEAESEDEAFEQIRWGNVDYDNIDSIDDVTDLEVCDVEYGEQEYTVDVEFRVVSRGPVGDTDSVTDSLGDMLYGFMGQTRSNGDGGEVELTDFSITNVCS